MHRKEIKETLDYFYYPLKTEIKQCMANGTIINKESLQKFENVAFRYATLHTADSFKRCCDDPTKDNTMEMLFYFVNSDITHIPHPCQYRVIISRCWPFY